MNQSENSQFLGTEKISKLMTEETWLDYNAALEYGFIDGEIKKDSAILPMEALA